MSASTSLSSSPSLGNNGPQDTIAERQWEEQFHDPVKEDDNIWKEYNEEAAKFDERMIDQWNKVIDGILVYVALFLSVLAALVVVTVSQFKRDPAEISNDLLFEIYNNQKNGSSETLNRGDFFDQKPGEHHKAVIYNALLYADLALSIVVSMIALFSKIWVINYRDQVNSPGSQYKRALERQEAYNGVLAWRMIQIIDSLPFLLLIAVFMLGVYVYQSIRIEQDTIGYVIGGMLLLGFIFLILASVAAAFIPACPFKSSLTTLIKLLFESIVLFFRLIRGRYQPPWILNIIKYYRTPRKRYINRDINRVQHDGEAMKLRTTSESSHVQDHVTVHQSGQAAHRKHSALLLLIMILVVSIVVLVVLVLSVLKSNSGTYYALICLPFAASLSIFGNLPRSYERPPRYGLEYWIFLASVVIAPFMIAASYYSDSRRDKFMGLFFTGCGLQLLFTVFGALLFTFTPETRDTDAVAWLLVSTASQKPEHFRKAGQISNKPPNLEHKSEHPNASNYDHRKASLLTSLQPLLSSLITSKLQTLKDGTKNQAFPAEETLKDVEIYVACLAQLSNFENFHGSIWKNQSAVIHPVLSPQKEKSPLESALEEISTNPNGKFNSLLTSAARDALQHYKGGEKTEGRNQCISQVKIQDSDCDDLGYAKIQDSDCDDLGYALPYHTYNGHGRL